MARLARGFEGPNSTIAHVLRYSKQIRPSDIFPGRNTSPGSFAFHPNYVRSIGGDIEANGRERKRCKKSFLHPMPGDKVDIYAMANVWRNSQRDEARYPTDLPVACLPRVGDAGLTWLSPLPHCYGVLTSTGTFLGRCHPHPYRAALTNPF